MVVITYRPACGVPHLFAKICMSPLLCSDIGTTFPPSWLSDGPLVALLVAPSWLSYHPLMAPSWPQLTCEKQARSRAVVTSAPPPFLTLGLRVCCFPQHSTTLYTYLSIILHAAATRPSHEWPLRVSWWVRSAAHGGQQLQGMRWGCVGGGGGR